MPVTLLSDLADLPDTLVEQFAAGDGLLWTGAGVSRRHETEASDGSTITVGVPAGAALERHLRRWTPQPHPAGAVLEELATLYEHRRGRHRLNRLLRTAYLLNACSAPPFYDLIARLPACVRIFVTTNYDPFLEHALARRHPSLIVVEQELEGVSQRRPAVYHVHGSSSSPSSCVITTPDYDRWERDAKQLKEKLSTLFVEHTVVALGYGARDGNFRRLLGAANEPVLMRGGQLRPVFVVTPDAALEDFAAYDVPEYNLILVRSTGEAFLDWLLARLDAHQRAVDADALSILIDSPIVRNAREYARSTQPEGLPALTPSEVAPDEQWEAHGESLLLLAVALDGAQQAGESIRTQADAARAFRVAGMDTRADAAACSAYTAALKRRDARLASELSRRLTRPVAALKNVFASLDEDVAYAAAFAEVLTGAPSDPPPLLIEWEGKLLGLGAGLDEPANKAPATPTTAGESASEVSDTLTDRRAHYRAWRLRAEYEVTVLNFDSASNSFAHAARHAPSVEDRSECQVRAALFRGLSAGTDGSHSLIEARVMLRQILPLPQSTELLYERAVAWLAALEGDLAVAIEGFIDSGRRALVELDPVAASAAFRSAEWALRQRFKFVPTESNPGMKAYRLESSVARYPYAARVSTHELLEEANERLGARKTREAWIVALAAQRLAYDDIDPSGVHRARIALAEVWERILDEGGDALNDDFSVYCAIRYGAYVHAELDDGQRKRRGIVFRRALIVNAEAPWRNDLVAMLASSAVSRGERVGALMLLTELVPALNQQDIDQVAIPLLRAGIVDGWQAVAIVNAPRAACGLLRAISNRLSSEAAATIRDALALTEETTPSVFRSEFYVALAQATDRADPPPDGGAFLADQLLATLGKVRAASEDVQRLCRDDLGAALAAVSLHATPEVANVINRELEHEAVERFWRGVAVLSARGGAVSQSFLDDYLREMTSRIQEQTRSFTPGFFAMFASDDYRITQRAGENASLSVRNAAVDAVIALLLEDRQQEQCRAPWVGFAVRLARGMPNRLAEVVAALCRVATGEVKPSGYTPPFGNHPLSSLRVSGMSTGVFQAASLTGLGVLWSHAAETERIAIQAALAAALHNPDVIIRDGAIAGVRSTVMSALAWGSASTPVTAGWQVEYLVRRLADPLPTIQAAARDALVAFASPGDPQ